jgi:hypothetical protein
MVITSLLCYSMEIMSGMDPENSDMFKELHAGGLQASKRGNFRAARKLFEMADELAVMHEDDCKRLDALNPLARALWNAEDFYGATDKLVTAIEIARELKLPDEEAIAISNLGRMAAVRVVRLYPAEDVPEALGDEAVPRFEIARKKLAGHPHYHYRYANAHHGAPVAAIAGKVAEAEYLIGEGMRVARRTSPEPYDQVVTFELNTNGLHQIALALMYLAHDCQDEVLLGQMISQIH